MEKINSFSGKYLFLSNFFPSSVVYQALVYPTVEHAFQATKCVRQEDHDKVRKTFYPAKAKQLGKSFQRRANWNEIKQDVMYKLVTNKFKVPALRQLLLATGNKELIEGNYWGDTYWGVCKGVGTNHLGKILMRVREDIRLEE